MLCDRGTFGQAQILLDQALPVHRARGDRRSEGMCLGQSAIIAKRTARLADARDLYERALAIHLELGDRRLAAGVLGNLANVDMEQGEFEVAEERLNRSLRMHREIGQHGTVGLRLGNLGNLHQLRGDLDQARAFHRQALVIHRELGRRRLEALTLGNLAHVEARIEPTPVSQARKSVLVAAFEEAGRLHDLVGAPSGRSIVMANLGGFLLRIGERDEARRVLDDALSIAIGSKAAILTAIFGGIRALLDDDLATALERLDQGEATLRGACARYELALLLARRARVLQSHGDPERAAAAKAHARGIAGDVPWGERSELAELLTGGAM